MNFVMGCPSSAPFILFWAVVAAELKEIHLAVEAGVSKCFF
jgi:hypothetical protein